MAYGQTAKNYVDEVPLLTTAEAYQATLDEIERHRIRFAKEHQAAANALEKEKILNKASFYIEETIANQVAHYWYGTRFDRNGISTNPGTGLIACSYFISTTLEHAGFKVNRKRLAQQSPLHIIQSLSGKNYTQLHSRQELFDHTRAHGEGLYVVGFKTHVGFIYHTYRNTYLIHSSPLPPTTVARVNVYNAASFKISPSFYIGKLGDNQKLILNWLKGWKIQTVLK